jgi:glycosyltransferase involved in cell wall biosynthesis
MRGTGPVGPDAPDLSVVIPFYNEEASAAFVLDELRAALEPLGPRYEVVAVDDGSGDGTLLALGIAAGRDSRFRILHWEPNRGQAAALYWGLRQARAPIVVTMDGDGQNDPADIPGLLADLEGADMVVGIRADRRDSWLRRRMSRLANAVRGRLLRDHVRDSGCALKAFRSEVIESFIALRTLYSFMPALAVAAGFVVRQRTVHHRPRTAGTSSYGLWKFLWRPFVDLLGMWWFTRRRFELPRTAVAVSGGGEPCRSLAGAGAARSQRSAAGAIFEAVHTGRRGAGGSHGTQGSRSLER